MCQKTRQTTRNLARISVDLFSLVTWLHITVPRKSFSESSFASEQHQHFLYLCSHSFTTPTHLHHFSTFPFLEFSFLSFSLSSLEEEASGSKTQGLSFDQQCPRNPSPPLSLLLFSSDTFKIMRSMV